MTCGETRIAALAAAYAFGLARNHAFIDGDKRIAVQALFTFLAMNGRPLTANPVDAADVILRLAAGEFDEDQLTDWIESHSAV